VGVAVVLIKIAEVKVEEASGDGGSLEEEGSTRTLIYVCNEMGVIRAYDLSPLLERLKLQPLSSDDLPITKSNYYPGRKVARIGRARRGSTLLKEMLAGGSARSFLPEEPLESDMNLLHAWVAHQDTILSLEVVVSPGTLFTSSRDMSVKVWSIDGTPLGVLTWGRALDVVRSCYWKFPLDLATRQSNRHSKAQKLLQDLQTRTAAAPAKPDGSSASLPQAPGVIEAIAKLNDDKGNILGQIHQEKSWEARAPTSEREGAREMTSVKLQQPVRVYPGSTANTKEDDYNNKKKKKRRRKARRRSGARCDAVLRSIREVDKVIARYQAAELDERARLAVSGKLPEDPFEESRTRDLRGKCEERHKIMYPNLHVDDDDDVKIEARAWFTKVMVAMGPLSDLPPPKPLRPATTTTTTEKRMATVSTQTVTQRYCRSDQHLSPGNVQPEEYGPQMPVLATPAKTKELPPVDNKWIIAMTRPTQASQLKESPAKCAWVSLI